MDYNVNKHNRFVTITNSVAHANKRVLHLQGGSLFAIWFTANSMWRRHTPWFGTLWGNTSMLLLLSQWRCQWRLFSNGTTATATAVIVPEKFRLSNSMWWMFKLTCYKRQPTNNLGDHAKSIYQRKTLTCIIFVNFFFFFFYIVLILTWLQRKQ